MSRPNHNIYDNIRTRVIILHRGSLLLNPPAEEGEGWRPPGGALEPAESLQNALSERSWKKQEFRFASSASPF